MALSYADAVKNLTGPGGPFEMITETVRGLPMRTFKHREKSMREKVASAGLRGATDFLVHGDRRISYGEFTRLVWGTAAALQSEHGLERGDRVAILSYNSPDWLIALFAATSLGGIGVGLNGWWTTAEIEYGLRDSGSRFLVVDERLYPRVAPLVGKIPRPRAHLLHRQRAAAGHRADRRDPARGRWRPRASRSPRTIRS